MVICVLMRDLFIGAIHKERFHCTVKPQVTSVLIYEQFFLLNFNLSRAIRTKQEVSIRCFIMGYYKYPHYFYRKICFNIRVF